MLFIAGVPGEDPAMISSKADVVLQIDDVGIGTKMVGNKLKNGGQKPLFTILSQDICLMKC